MESLTWLSLYFLLAVAVTWAADEYGITTGEKTRNQLRVMQLWSLIPSSTRRIMAAPRVFSGTTHEGLWLLHEL